MYKNNFSIYIACTPNIKYKLPVLLIVSDYLVSVGIFKELYSQTQYHWHVILILHCDLNKDSKQGLVTIFNLAFYYVLYSIDNVYCALLGFRISSGIRWIRDYGRGSPSRPGLGRYANR